jgi:hypothetical protein
MRQHIVLAVSTTSLLLLAVMAGCGTLDLDLYTTVKNSGDIIQEVRFEGTGMMANILDEADLTEDFIFGEEGWEFEIDRTDDSLVITAVGNYVLDEDGNISRMEGGPEIPEGFSVRVESGFLSKKYFAEFDAPANGEELIGDGGEFGDFTDIMLEDMFDFSWTIILPGGVVESNADIIEGGSATWDFDINSLTSGFNLTVQSRYTNWPVIGAIISGAVVVLALVAFFFIRRRRADVHVPSEITY